MTDIEIAKRKDVKNIKEIAKTLGIEDFIIEYGLDKAKIKFDEIPQKKNGKLILVTSINPTPYGEGKTTVAIGLLDGLRKLGKNAVAVLREPSLGPVFGIKGGATGGGYSQMIPMEDINLHFTGDFHAITTANNLISSAIDNHIYFGNELDIDVNNVCFKRCLDLNDRALRSVSLTSRDEVFNITAASEIMSILCLCSDIQDLKTRLANILIAYNTSGDAIYCKDLGLEGALTVILKDAIRPNLVQSLENNPVIVHGGPFANIAHGCNSVIATKLGLSLADYVITEAGFGSDLGAEKFFDIKCRSANLEVDTTLIVATIKALKYHGKDCINSLEEGISNLDIHIDNMLNYTNNVVVALNRYQSDDEEEINFIKKHLEEKNIPFAINTSYVDGGEGAVDLASKVIKSCDNSSYFKLLYDNSLSIYEKIKTIATKIYHVEEVIYEEKAKERIEKYIKMGYSTFPICVAKSQYTLSGSNDNKTIIVRDASIYTGAKFIVIYLSDINAMPGLPKCPNYLNIDIDSSNNIKGLF